MKIVLAGAVQSSRVTLERLLAHGADVRLVLGYEPRNSSLVSGYVNLSQLAGDNRIPYAPFQSINSPAVVERIREVAPDVFFVVGLSQLISKDLLALPAVGSVGFHPTALPKGRGRAPLAWIVLDQAKGAATLFELQEDSDSGAIFVQEPFAVEPDDDATVVERKLLEALTRALDAWLPRLLAGEWQGAVQNEEEATWYGKRAQEDGLIRWADDAAYIARLIRATTRPHPGAFTFYGPDRITVWACRPGGDTRFKGVTGRVLAVDAAGHALVQSGTTPLWLTEYQLESASAPNTGLKVGYKLGYDVELEINRILKQLTPSNSKDRP